MHVKINKMKKSQLRKIIRESIKELITEQPQGKYIMFETCAGSNTSGFCHPDLNVQLGDYFKIDSGHYSPLMNGRTGFVREITYLCNNPGTVSPITDCPNCCTQHPPSPNWVWSGFWGQTTPQGACWDACDWPISFNCTPVGNHPKFGSKCIDPGDGTGTFATKQECLDSGCEPKEPDVWTGKDLTTLTPFTGPTPQPKMAQPDDERTRMQEIANIR